MTDLRTIVHEELEPVRAYMRALDAIRNAADEAADDAELGQRVRAIIRDHAAEQIAWATRAKAEGNA